MASVDWCAQAVCDRALQTLGFLQQVQAGTREAVQRTDPEKYVLEDLSINDVCRADTLCLDDGRVYIYI